MTRKPDSGAPLYSTEPKKFNIRAARNPRRGVLSGVVVVRDSIGAGFSYIQFSDELEVAVGRVMPRGVSVHDPAYLRAVELPGEVGWRVYAQYLHSNTRRFLWSVNGEKPAWLRRVYREAE